MHELRELLAGHAEDVPLDVAALQIAMVEYPEISVEPFLVLLDSYASEFGDRVDANTDGEQFVRLLNEYLFEELGFQGNQNDYYNPANSCLNEVLTKRMGIPITLSLVYMEVGRRLGRNIQGIGLPGHFLVRFEDLDYQFFIDPFHEGRIINEADCYELATAYTGLDMSSDSSILSPVSKRHIAVRMLNNLRAVYFRQGAAEKAIRVLDLFIEALPGSGEEYKQRGLCFAQLQQYESAREDLETYLRLVPEAIDRQQVEVQILQFRKAAHNPLGQR